MHQMKEPFLPSNEFKILSFCQTKVFKTFFIDMNSGEST